MSSMLFIQGSSRWHFDTNGDIYADTSFEEELWERRYRRYCDQLTVAFRRDERIYAPEEAKGKYERYNTEKSQYAVLPDLLTVKNVFSPKLWRETRRTISEEVKKADKLVVRSVSNLYTITALKYARKYKKDYLVEVSGVVWDALWNHSVLGKVLAPIMELECRRLVKEAPYAVYVTEKALQKRYPCKGKTLGCSDVIIQSVSEKVIQKRIKRIKNRAEKKLVIGTVANMDVRPKGHRFVIRALAELKKRGIDCFEFQAVGAGSGEKWMALAEKLGVADKVHIVGTLPHEQIFPWMDQLDIYVQPSLQEGLCRALVEATSRACPVVSSNVGGNGEVVPSRCIFRRKKYKQLVNILQRLTDPAEMEQEARTSYETSHRYDSALLDAKRDAFYMNFMRD